MLLFQLHRGEAVPLHVQQQGVQPRRSDQQGLQQMVSNHEKICILVRVYVYAEICSNIKMSNVVTTGSRF